MMKKTLLLFALVIAFAGCGGGGDSSAPLFLPNNNEKLDGAYIAVLGPPMSMKFYMVFNGKGTMTQVGVPSPLNPPGKYSVSTNDDFKITITNPVDGNIVLTGALTSPTSFSFTATQDLMTWGTGTIEKVTNIAECSDTWTGILAEDAGGATHELTSVVVDTTGAVTGGTITTAADADVFDRGVFCTGTHMAGLLVTQAAEDSYQMIMIWGDYDAGPSKTISNGRFESDGDEVGALTFRGL